MGARGRQGREPPEAEKDDHEPPIEARSVRYHRPFQVPSRSLPGPFQVPSRSLPGPFQVPAAQLPILKGRFDAHSAGLRRAYSRLRYGPAGSSERTIHGSFRSGSQVALTRVAMGARDSARTAPDSAGTPDSAGQRRTAPDSAGHAGQRRTTGVRAAGPGDGTGSSRVPSAYAWGGMRTRAPRSWMRRA